MLSHNTSVSRLLATALVTAALALFAASAAWANEYASEDTAALLKVLGNSKLSLAQGIQQVAKGGAAAISAKFELDDNKALSLSVYTAEKGLAIDSEHNVLKEFSGAPEQTPWSPEAEVFQDLPHVSRASEQLTLMALAKSSLADFIAAAEKQHPGMVFSAIPEVHNHRPVLVVLLADHGKVSEVRYDLETRRAIAPK